MGFSEDLKFFAETITSKKELVQTEEAVKLTFVMPFLQLLGYNIFDPNEVIPEFTADIGTKKGEKVDFAIIHNDKPHILIEVKGLNEVLEAHNTQLYRYFHATSAKFAILTNGIVYQFFSDLDEINKMDAKPFLVLDLENIKEQILIELEKFIRKNMMLTLYYQRLLN